MKAAHSMVCLLILGLLCHAVLADDFVWQDTCGTGLWSSFCQIGWCDPQDTVPYYANNWGRTMCYLSLEAPGPSDDVFLGGATVQLDTIGSVHNLSVGGTLEIVGTSSINGWLTVTGPTITNSGVIGLPGTLLGSCLCVGGDEVTLTGGGTVTLSNSSGSIIKGTGLYRLTNQDNLIQGAGNIGSTWISLTNQATIDANQPTALIVQPNSSGVTNTGTMQASNGGTLHLYSHYTNNGGTIRARDASLVELNGATIAGGSLITEGTGKIRNLTWAVLDGTDAGLVLGPSYEQNDGTTTTLKGTITGTGGWTADGGTIFLSSGTNVATSDSIAIRNNGLIQLTSATMAGSDLTMDTTGQLTVSGSITLSGHLTFAMTSESKWSWASGATLTITGGTGGCQLVPWATLEVGGTDGGQATGYSNNFDLSVLAIGNGARVALVDWVDNGNRAGDKAEALYADTLTIGTGATLNLNGLKLYVDGSQVLSGPRGGGQVVDGYVAQSPDFNGDCDVDADDWTLFEACATGPAVPCNPASLPPVCKLIPDGNGKIPADFDGDGDVDQDDFGIFQRCYSGTDPADPNCVK